MKKNNNRVFGIILIVLLSAVLITSVSITIALSDKMKATGDVLSRLRHLMTGSTLDFEPLFAYIVPSDDAHQVSLLNELKAGLRLEFLRSKLFRVNILHQETVDELSLLDLQEVQEQP